MLWFLCSLVARTRSKEARRGSSRLSSSCSILMLIPTNILSGFIFLAFLTQKIEMLRHFTLFLMQFYSLLPSLPHNFSILPPAAIYIIFHVFFPATLILNHFFPIPLKNWSKTSMLLVNNWCNNRLAEYQDIL